MLAYIYPLLSLILVLNCWTSTAEETVRYGIRKNVVSQFPDKNGVFWSHGVSDEIFTKAGYQSKVVPRPAKRLPLSLNNDEIDIFYTTDVGLGEFKNQFIRAKLPTAMMSFYIYYDHRKNWQPVWPPDNTFKQKIGKSVHSSIPLREHDQLNISMATSFDAPVKMVNLNRADYYIEHEGGFVSVTPGLLKIPAQGFTTKVLFLKGVYAFFQKNDKGRQLEKLYNTEQLALYKRGELGRVFFNNTPVYVGSKAVDDAVRFINDTYPQLNLPEQPSGKIADTTPGSGSISFH